MFTLCHIRDASNASVAGTWSAAIASSRVAMRGADGPGGTHSTTARAAPVLMAAMCSGAATTLRFRTAIELGARRGTLDEPSMRVTFQNQSGRQALA